jgi:hypothetical protein
MSINSAVSSWVDFAASGTLWPEVKPHRHPQRTISHLLVRSLFWPPAPPRSEASAAIVVLDRLFWLKDGSRDAPSAAIEYLEFTNISFR